MAWRFNPVTSTNSLFKSSPSGVTILQTGPLYVQHASTATLANSTTETTIFSSGIDNVVADSGLGPQPQSSLYLPANSLTVGTIIRGYARGIIANTGTPNLTTRAGIVNSASAFTALATTGAVAMTTISTSDYEIGFEFQVKSVGTSGVIFASVYHRYGSTIVFKQPVTNTVDTTQAFTIDCRTTWGAASASNTQTVYYAIVTSEG
jgi:hypothetical protein